ncbi:MAG TPA: hypothetical protein VK157_17720 [Phycisphaerales bacterium]|nr:hypothetical protein [Phycisphaerales bacterium]
MAKRPDLTNYQRKIVDRYYQHQDTIYATKLAELATEIALASDAKKVDAMWKRAREYLLKCGGDEATVAKICDGRDMKLLGQAVSAVAAGKPVPKYM